jgi:hypothetical protein
MSESTGREPAFRESDSQAETKLVALTILLRVPKDANYEYVTVDGIQTRDEWLSEQIVGTTTVEAWA